MQPFLIFGGNSRSRREYALQVAQENNWLFFQVEVQNYDSKLYKASVTFNLPGTVNLIYISRIEKLGEKDLERLLSYVEESPHRFVLSTSGFYKLPKEFRQKCHLIKIGELQPEKFFDALQKLMSEPDREKVRELLSDPEVNIEVMLHILKDNIWKSKNPESFKAVESCLNNLYKVNKKFLISILSYLFPPTKLIMTYPRNDRKVYKIRNRILKKIKKKYRVSTFEGLETFRMIKQILPRQPEFGSELVKVLDLTERERKYLGIQKPIKQKETSIHPTPVNIPESNLSRWM